jgi:hypothetical protein
MITAAALFALLIVSGGFGVLLYRARTRAGLPPRQAAPGELTRAAGSRFRIIMWLASLVFAVFFTLAGAWLFFVLRSKYDSADASYLPYNRRLELVFLQGSPAPEILVAQQTRAQVGGDFQIAIQVNGAPQGFYKFELVVPKSLEPRTVDRCEGGQMAAGSSYACARIGPGPLEVRWQVTPTAPGQPLSTVVLPESLRPAKLVGPSWTSNVKVDDSPLVLGGDLGSLEYRRPAPLLMLSATKPRLHVEPFLVDLARGTITTQVNIVGSLGVSEHTYTILAIIGTTLAGGLGSGWLVQLVGWIIRRRNPVAPTSASP